MKFSGPQPRSGLSKNPRNPTFKISTRCHCGFSSIPPFISGLRKRFNSGFKEDVSIEAAVDMKFSNGPFVMESYGLNVRNRLSALTHMKKPKSKIVTNRTRHICIQKRETVRSPAIMEKLMKVPREPVKVSVQKPKRSVLAQKHLPIQVVSKLRFSFCGKERF